MRTVVALAYESGMMNVTAAVEKKIKSAITAQIPKNAGNGWMVGRYRIAMICSG